MNAVATASRFTASDDAAVEGYVGGLLAQVVQAVVAQLGPELAGILLVGGFGRGEGGVLRRPDGTLHVVNDFDLELVYREPFGPALSKLWVQLRHRRAVRGLAEQLAGRFAMKQVDLTLRGEASLRRRSGKLADYDLQHGHRLLWGRSDPCAHMPALGPRDIAPFEATWLLRNRGIGLLLARLYLDRGALHDEDRENFYIEVNKAWLAMGDALWVLAGRYTVCYADRAENFDALRDQDCPDHDELAAGYRQACAYKLRPVADPYPGGDAAVLWEAVAQLYGRFFLWIEGRRLGLAFADLPAYARWLDAQPRSAGASPVRRWLEGRLGVTGDCPESLRPLRHDAPRSVLCVAALIAARCADTNAQQVLQRWPVPGDAALGWSRQARGLLGLMHPSGEVGRFLAQTAPRPAPVHLRAEAA